MQFGEAIREREAVSENGKAANKMPPRHAQAIYTAHYSEAGDLAGERV
jgi:hypothetical protein